MADIRKIKVPLIDFTEAEDNGFVYGWDLNKRPIESVYVELGIEDKRYRYSDTGDLKTDYRKFVRCTVYEAQTDEDADNQLFTDRHENVTVIIYC